MGFPQPTVTHRQTRCPGVERHRDASFYRTVPRSKTRPLDGIKMFDESGYDQIFPDPAELLVHLYAEGLTEDKTAEPETDYVALIEGAVASREGVPAAERLSIAWIPVIRRSPKSFVL